MSEEMIPEVPVTSNVSENEETPVLTVVEEERTETLPDLSGKSLAELAGLFEELTKKDDRMKRSKEAESIKSAFYKKLLKDKADAGLEAVPADIAENPHNYSFSEIEAASLPRVLADVDAAVINGNYAIPAGLIATRDGLFIENADSPYVNVIAVNDGNQDDPKVQALVSALKGDKVREYVAERYPNGEVVLVD